MIRRLRLAISSAYFEDELYASGLFLVMAILFFAAAAFPLAARSLCALFGAGFLLLLLAILLEVARNIVSVYRAAGDRERRKVAEDVMNT